MNTDESEKIAREVASSSGELGNLLRQHLNDYDELLPFVFLGDVTRWIEARFAEGDTGPVLPVLDHVVQLYEESGDEGRNLLKGGLFYNFNFTSTFYPRLRERFVGAALDGLEEVERDGGVFIS